MVKITFKPTNENTFDETFDLNQTKTVFDIKTRVANKLNVTVDKLKFIHKGKILKDEQALNTLGLGETETFHLVVKKDEAPPGSQTTGSTGGFNTGAQQGFGGIGGMGGMGGLGGMGGGMGGLGGMSGVGGMNPNDLTNMMSNIDPQMLQQIIQNNPMIQAMAANNPQVQAMLSNPEMLKQMLNPQMIQMAMSQFGSMGGLGGMGGLGQGTQGTGAQGAQGSGQNMPNFSQMMNVMSGLGLGGMGAPQPPAGTDPKQYYKDQLKQLSDMGFTNESVNIDVLKQTGGNVEAAVERLLSMMG